MTYDIHEFVQVAQERGWTDTQISIRLRRDGFSSNEIRDAMSPQQRLLNLVPDDMPVEWKIPLLRIVKAEAEAQMAKDPIKRAMATAEAQRLAEDYMRRVEEYNRLYAERMAEQQPEARPTGWRRGRMGRLLATPGYAR